MPLNIVLIFIIIFVTNLSFSQYQRGDFRIVFYNVENLFDVVDDPQTTDEEYLPGQVRFWNNKRFKDKLTNISKVIVAAGGWESPEIIGLCEVENKYVVEQLLKSTQLEKVKYKIIHKESPDKRGIDVSLIYNSDRFTPLKYEYIPIQVKGSTLATREILYLSGIPGDTSDTIHLFVNHWPSRYSGYLETVGFRIEAAKILRCAVDKLYKELSDPKIIIMGDFNDQPSDKSISEILISNASIIKKEKEILINLSSEWNTNDLGTIKYQSQWLVYDQFVVSQSLLGSEKGVSCKVEDAQIFKNELLLEKDLKYGGFKPFRTYSGMKYNGGFSDHLPVYLDLFFR